MKYDVFMRTRTYDRDYHWVNKPAYMPEGVYSSCKSIIELCEKEAYDSLVCDDWYSNFYYLRLEGCCLLLRVAKTKYTCPEKQRIISFEGIVVKAVHEKRLFCNIPGLINEMLPPSKSFRSRLEEDGTVPDTFELKTLFEPFATRVPEEVHPAVNNAAFGNLLKFTAFADKIEGYVFGKNAKDFSAHLNKEKLGIVHIFDSTNPDSIDINENAFTDSYKPLTCEYKELVPTGQDRVTINLLVQEKENSTYRYKWEIKPWDTTAKDSKRIRYSTRFFDIEDRVELAKLELQKESIRQFLIGNGWKKQPIGLRFEKNLYQQEEPAP